MRALDENRCDTGLLTEGLGIEMSGLRDQLTCLRAESLDMSADLLAILGPVPTPTWIEVDAPAPRQAPEPVFALRVPAELVSGPVEF